MPFTFFGYIVAPQPLYDDLISRPRIQKIWRQPATEH